MSSLLLGSGNAAGTGTASTCTGWRWPQRLPAQYAPSTSTRPSANRRTTPPLLFPAIILTNLPRLRALLSFHFLKPGDQRNDLLPRMFERARAVNHFISHAAFFFVRHLCGDALPGLLECESTTCDPGGVLPRETRKLLFGCAPRDHKAVKLRCVSGFDQQGSLNNRNRMRVGTLDRVKFAILRF